MASSEPSGVRKRSFQPAPHFPIIEDTKQVSEKHSALKNFMQRFFQSLPMALLISIIIVLVIIAVKMYMHQAPPFFCDSDYPERPRGCTDQCPEYGYCKGGELLVIVQESAVISVGLRNRLYEKGFRLCTGYQDN